MRPSSFLRSCTYITSFVSSVRAFSVTFGTPTQCDDFTVSWIGGEAPFEILLTPKFHPLYNISVPSSAFSNGQGSYSISQLQIPSGEQFLLTMSDATGFGSGGTTTLLTVGAPIAGNNCNTNGSQDFTFQLPSQLKQCAVFNFTAYDGAIQPITITGLIPGGTPVLLYPPIGSNYSWIATVREGTSLLFFITDSQSRQGGVSDIETVQDSTDASCLVVGSASSTVSAPSQPTSGQSTPSSNAVNAGVIAGATVGSVAFLSLLVVLGICCRRKMIRSSDVVFSKKGLEHKVDRYGVQQDEERQNVSSKHQTDRQLESPSQMYNVSTGDPVSQHVRQMSLTESVAGNSSVTSASRLMTGMGGRTSPNTYPYQTPPIHPVTQSHPANMPPGIVAFHDPHAQFSQVQPSHQVSNLDSFVVYGDPSVRRMATIPAQPISPKTPIGHIVPSGTLRHHTSAGDLTASDPPSPPSQAQHLNLSSNVERFAMPADAGSAFPGVRSAAPADETGTNQTTEFIMHTDVEDVPAARRIVELPPQYADRQLVAPQDESAPSSP